MPIGNGNYSWKVVHDPLGVGGFGKDTRFSEEDVVHMLRFHTFTMGTILFHRQYGKFEVTSPSRIDSPCRLVNRKYLVMVSTGQKLTMLERDGRRVTA